jgi:hypothetical protein
VHAILYNTGRGGGGGGVDFSLSQRGRWPLHACGAPQFGTTKRELALQYLYQRPLSPPHIPVIFFLPPPRRQHGILSQVHSDLTHSSCKRVGGGKGLSQHNKDVAASTPTTVVHAGRCLAGFISYYHLPAYPSKDVLYCMIPMREILPA